MKVFYSDFFCLDEENDHAHIFGRLLIVQSIDFLNRISLRETWLDFRAERGGGGGKEGGNEAQFEREIQTMKLAVLVYGRIKDTNGKFRPKPTKANER